MSHRLTLSDEELAVLEKKVGAIKIADSGLDLREHGVLLHLYVRLVALRTRNEAKKGGKAGATT